MTLERAGALARWLAGLLAFALGARFAFVAVHEAWNRPTVSVAVPVTSSRAPQFSLPDLHAIPGFTGPVPDLTHPEGTSAPKAAEKPREKIDTVRVSLIVTHGPPRSDVIVDGVVVGQSPYVGDLACRRGVVLKIDILPKRGMPRRFERVCEGDTLRVEEAGR